MRITFAEQDVIDACCVYASTRAGCSPEQVDVDLGYDAALGYSAQVLTPGSRRLSLGAEELVEACQVYLSDYYNFDGARLQIELTFDRADGVGALIRTI